MPALAATGTGEGGRCHLRLDQCGLRKLECGGANWIHLPVTGGFRKNEQRGGSDL